MKVGKNYFEPEYGFLAMEKDFSLIANAMLTDEKLLKLLYYTQPDCMKGPDLTTEQKLSLIHHQIRIVPKVDVDKDCPNFVLITFTDFEPNAKNPEFMDCKVNFNILCHPDHWNLGNFQLRPYKIAGEIQKLFNKKKMTGIGTMQFDTGDTLVLNEQLMGLILKFNAIYGGEDEVNPLSE